MGCCSTGACGSGCRGCKIGFVLIMIGSINWGFVGLGNLLSQDLNVVHMVVGRYPVAESVIYVLVGLAGVVKLLKLCKNCKA